MTVSGVGSRVGMAAAHFDVSASIRAVSFVEVAEGWRREMVVMGVEGLEARRVERM